MIKRYIKKSPLGYFHCYHEEDGKIISRRRFSEYSAARIYLKTNRDIDGMLWRWGTQAPLVDTFATAYRVTFGHNRGAVWTIS